MEARKPQVRCRVNLLMAAMHRAMSEKCRFCCKSRLRPMMSFAVSLGVTGRVPLPRRSPRNFYATQYTEPERVAVAQPAMRAAVGSEQWRPEQTRPERLAGLAVGADRASGCA